MEAGELIEDLLHELPLPELELLPEVAALLLLPGEHLLQAGLLGQGQAGHRLLQVLGPGGGGGGGAVGGAGGGQRDGGGEAGRGGGEAALRLRPQAPRPGSWRGGTGGIDSIYPHTFQLSSLSL